MKEINIKSFTHFHEQMQSYDSAADIYRGVTDKKYQLIPKIGRIPMRVGHTRKVEEGRMFRRFVERAIPYLDFMPRNDWEWLATAQHYGLPTRLLDWTRNPLVALYFAVEHKTHKDSAVYVLKGYQVLSTEMHENPFEYSKVGKFVPHRINPRISAQIGVFTIHPELEEPLLSDDIDKLIIANEMRNDLKKVLDMYGINRATLFPDLDGLTQHIAWQRTAIYFSVNETKEGR